VTSAVRVVDVSGSRREIGRAHGEEARSLIGRGLERWFGVIEPRLHTSGEAYVASFLDATEFPETIERYTPELLEEVKGIAEGARQDFDVILAYQLMDEEWAYRSTVMRTRGASVEACSAAGILREDAPTILAQNMDLPSHYDGTQVLLRLRPDGGPETMIFTPAGLIGTTGLNSHGLGVCVNAMSQLRHRSSGLPVGFILRAMLARKTANEAAAFVRAVPHATGQNYLIGDPGALFDFEASPGRVSELHAEAGQLRHTNHPLVNQDLDPDMAGRSDSTTVERLDRLERDLKPLAGRATVEDLKRTLSDREVPVCVPRGSSWMTLGSVVMELSDAPVLHVALGPPADTPYTTARFS
jgi:hypothetical protein